MQTINYDLPALLKRIQAKLYVIPQFQRDFVWRESQVKLLIDSIARNYPIGSLLTLTKSPQIPLQSRDIEAAFLDDEMETEREQMEDPAQETQFVLDGQQRITAIARAFLNSHPKRNYYFDLKAMHEHFHEEDTGWIVTRERGKSPQERRDKGRLLRADVVRDQQKTDIYVSEYLEDSGDFPQFVTERLALRQAAARIKGVFETIRKFQVPVVVLDRDAPLESVCRVFETINSTGTRLTTFDLAVARFFPALDLRKMFDESRRVYPELAEFEVDGERVLQILALWNAHVNNRFPEATRAVLLNLNEEFVNKNWDRAAESLARAYSWVRRNGVRKPTWLSMPGLLVSLAVFNITHADWIEKPAPNYQTILRRWYFSKAMQPVKSTATNYGIGQDFALLAQWAEFDKNLDIPSVHISVEKLQNSIRHRDNRYRVLQCIMAMKATEDLMTGKSLESESVDDHHIFPRSTPNLNSATINSLPNRIVVSSSTNRQLGSKQPLEYFETLRDDAIKKEICAAVNQRLAYCFIPGRIESPDFLKQFESPNFEVFLRERALLILAELERVIGASLVTSDGSEEGEMEDDD